MNSQGPFTVEDSMNSKDALSTADNSFSSLLNESMNVLFTGYLNGHSVEIRSIEEISLLYHMGCFGKGSLSRSKPNSFNFTHPILRKRQFHKRNFWYKKFQDMEHILESHKLYNEIKKLTSKIANKIDKNVIDLVSSEDDSDTDSPIRESFYDINKHEVVVVVPNSDSEGENYFENLSPKCCPNTVKVEEKLVLSLQEAYFLSYGMGCLQIVDSDNKIYNLEQCWNIFKDIDKNFIEKYIVYHYYRSKEYIVKSGIKFGGDYLLYKERPGISHAAFIVVIKYNDPKYKLDWLSVAGHVRMASTTVKEIIMVEVIKDSNRCSEDTNDLSLYSVKEVLLKRTVPVEIKEDTD